MKRFILSMFMGLSILYAKADNQYDGIFVTVAGSETCYKLDEVPTVTYADNNGAKVAQLKLQGYDVPVVSVELKDGATMQIIYGTYVPSSINDLNTKISVTEKSGKKYISGGRLIIIRKDGKQYNSNGTILK